MNSAILMTIARLRYVVVATAIVGACSVNAGAQDFELNEQTFNQWLFSASQGTFEPDSELTLTVEAIDRVCDLTESQKVKLELAGRGDFTRFQRQVDELRSQFVGKTYSQNEIGEIYQKIQPLGEIYQAGLLGKESLFSKVLEKNLTPEQAARFERIEAERRQARYKAKVGLFVAALQRSLALTDDQRRALVQLLVTETRPPKRFGQYDWYVILYQAGKIPDERYEQIIDAAQMKPLKQSLQQGIGMDQWLKQQKLIDE
jgi:hypothetical protein